MRGVRFLNIDFGLLIPVVVLLILGLTTLFSLNFTFFRTQSLFLIISFFFFIIFANVDYKAFQLYRFPIYIFSLVVLLLVLLLGVETRGVVRWVDVFGFRIQFSEILKPFLLVSFSSYLSNSQKSLKTFFITILFLLPIVLLIYKQPDLGNALIYAGVVILTLIAYGFPFVWLIIFSLLIFFISPFIFRFLQEYQRQRIFTFLSPTTDPLGTSYNTIQSIIAIGSGMFFGKGLGAGTQSGLRFLPERHTDFIFAALAEEFGFIGALAIIASFAFLLYRIYVIFVNSEDNFCKIFSMTSFFLILIQFFINTGMNLGLLPVVGIALPFVSYGGSSLLSNFILLGLLTSISRDFRHREVLEIR